MAGRARTKAQKAALKVKFLEELAKTGVPIAAATAAGVPWRTTYDWRDADPAFAEGWDRAIERSTQLLELEVVRRGRVGVKEPVYWRGEVVGDVTKYSDILLMFMLNARRPEIYRGRRDDQDGSQNGQHVNIQGPINVLFQEVAPSQPPSLVPSRSMSSVDSDASSS